MSLINGGVSLKQFLVLGPVPDLEDLQAGLVKDQFRPFQDGLEEERVGWCDWRNPLITPPDSDWVGQERYAVFSLRIDSRKIPAALLKAHVDLRAQQMVQEKDLAFLGKEARLSLQDEVKVELLRKVLPSLKIIDVAWDLKQGVLTTTASSSSTQGALTSIFMKSFGCELVPFAPLIIAGRVAPDLPTEALMALDPFDLELDQESES